MSTSAAPAGQTPVARVAADDLLLLASAPIIDRLAPALRSTFSCEVMTTQQPGAAETLLRERSFGLVLLEDCLPGSQPALADILYRLAAGAVVLEINFAICNVDRVLRQVRAADQRRRLETRSARAVALHTLRSELSSSLTGLLLESELAMHSTRAELAPALSNLIALGELLYRQMRP